MADTSGQNAVIILRINRALISALDDYAAEHGLTRSEVLRRAIVALTGVSPTDRKRRSDAGIPRSARPTELCAAHGSDLTLCTSHYSRCHSDACRCIMHS